MDMYAMYNGRKTMLIYIEKLHLDVPMTDIKVVNDVETNMGLISEGLIDNGSFEYLSEDTRSISIEDMLYFNDEDIYDDEFTNITKSKKKELSGAAPSSIEQQIAINTNDCDSCETSSDNIDAPLNSDDESFERKFPIFDTKKDMSNPILKLGMKFTDGKLFRAALRENSIRNGYEFNFKKNESNKVTVVCVEEECPWRIHASKLQDSSTFQIKNMIEHNVHPRKFKMNAVTSTWLAEKYMNRSIDDPKMDVTALMKAAKRDFSVFVSIDQAYRAKWKAKKRIEGDHKNQYLKVRSYCEMLMR